MKKNLRVLFTTSTIPAHKNDPLPAFVRDEAIWMKKIHPDVKITVLAPHSAYSNTSSYQKHRYYDEFRFHYFWPFRFEFLTGKGIQPALKKYPWLYIQLPGLFLAEFLATLFYTIRLRPDVIYAHWFTPQAITSAMAAKITRTPLVFDTQASDAIVLKNLPFSKKIVVGICRQAIAYTVPSQQTLDKLLFFTNDKNKDEIIKKATMVPYGTSPVELTEQLIKGVRKKYNLNNKEVVYFIGRLVDRKGVDILIRAFSKIDNRDDSKRLVIVGDGQIRDSLEKLTTDLGLKNSVIFTGFLTGKERYALLDIASVCVVPSVNIGDQAEGLPVVFMEGVTRNKAVVISDATGAHETVTNNVNAFVVRAGSVADLKNGILRALEVSSKKDKKFYSEVKILAEKFQWPYIAKKRYEVLLDIIDDSI